MRKFFLLGASALLFAGISFAQTHTLSGFVKETGSLESLPGATLRVQNSTIAAITNSYGFYSLSLPQGNNTIIVSYIGMVTDSFSVSVNENIRKDILLTPLHQVLGDVVVTAPGKKNIVRSTQISAHNIDIKNVKDMPALLGEKDVMKTIQLLPGVQRGAEGSAGLYVRGGSPDQNLIILDDAVVYNANHLFGFMSIFNGDAIKDIQMIKGGFPARYGERLSSVIDLTMKDGNKQSYHGEAGIGLISSRLVLEGPIQKNKSSFIVSARRTYADLIAKPFMKGDEKTGYYFYDLTAKLNFELNDKNKIYFSGYFSKDKYHSNKLVNRHATKYDFLWGNATSTFRWNHVFSPKVFSNLSLVYSNYNLNSHLDDRLDTLFHSARYNSNIRDVGLKYDVEYYAANKHTIKTGVKATAHELRPNAITVNQYEAEFNTESAEIYKSNEFNGYVEDDWRVTSAFSINYGARASAFSTESKTYYNIEPRTSLRLMLNQKTSLKAGYSIMNQYLHLLSNTGIGMPTDLWVPATSRLTPQKSTQYALGLAKNYPGMYITLEGYYKEMDNILAYRDGASFLKIDNENRLEQIPFYENVIAGKGRSYGTELMLQKQTGRLTGWAAYTMAWVQHSFKEINNAAYFFPKHDRRHNLSLVGYYRLKPNIKLNSVFSFASGNPIRLPSHSFSVPRIPLSGDLVSYPDKFFDDVNDYTARGLFRSEAYHRLDVGIQFIKPKKRGERIWEISVYNLYNRLNPFYYAAETESLENDNAINKEFKLYKHTLFPIMPSVSYSYKF